MGKQMRIGSWISFRRYPNVFIDLLVSNNISAMNVHKEKSDTIQIIVTPA